MSPCEWNPTTNRPAWSNDPPHGDAVVNIHGYEGGIHVCTSCATLPVFKRYRKRSPLGREVGDDG